MTRMDYLKLISPVKDDRFGVELCKMMDYFKVNSLAELNDAQIKYYYAFKVAQSG